MKNTTLSAILICTFIAILPLSGCQNTGKVDPAPDIRIERDLTADIPKKYNVSTDVKIQDVSSILDYITSTDLSAISEFADIAVRGVVQEVVFTSFSGNAFTVVSFAVDECYKGDLQPGDLITVLHMGGYIPLQDHINYYDDAFRFEGLSSEEIANTVIHETYGEGESDPQVGDHNIYFLSPTDPDSGLPTEAYHRIRGAAGLLRVEPDGQTVSRINPDMPMDENPDVAPFSAQSNAEPYGNETFSLQEIVDIVSAN